MVNSSACAVLLGALLLLLLSAGIEDVRAREIANWKNAGIAMLAPAWWWANSYALWPDIGTQIALAAAVFALHLGAFHIGQMGGGDVKLIGALGLWLPFEPLVWMVIIMALTGGVLTIVMLIDARVRRAGPPETPYGVAIAIAAMLTVGKPMLNQFG